MNIKTKIRDYAQLMKVRLSFMVVFSASMAYLWATHRNVQPATIFLLSIGGFLITGSANIINQILERSSDKLMKRTMLRPLPDGRMASNEALILALSTGFAGVILLNKISLLCGMLGAVALIMYGFIYTPLKKKTWLTVVPGAISGSLPVVIGVVAAKGTITHEAIILFLIQFVWQFPHTWSIAWLQEEEYAKSGIRMLPAGGKCKGTAALMMVSTFLMIPAAFLLAMYESCGVHVYWTVAIAGAILTAFSYVHYRNQTNKTALRLMLSSIAYLPIVLIILVIEKML